MSGTLAALVVSTALAGAAASEPALGEAFRAGIQAYDAQEWDQAIAAWEGLKRYRVEHPAVEYNLGNAYLKKKEYGRAVLHYERAERLDPGDRETRENLKLLRGLLVDEVPEPGGLARVAEELRRRVPLEETSWFAFGAWQVLGLATLIAIARSGAARRAAIGVAALALVALVVSGPLLYLQVAAAEDRGRLVVLEPSVEARSGPGEQYTTKFTIHEGLVVSEREAASGWQHVLLPNGLEGWVPAGSVERI